MNQADKIVKKSEIEFLLFVNKVRMNGARRCFPKDEIVAALEIQKMKLLNYLYY